MSKIYNIRWGSNVLTLGKKTRVMGIVNVTPDSFSDGGDFLSHGHAVSRGIKLYQAGADIIDIGGESTRPSSKDVTLDEEIRRVIPVIESLAQKIPIPISVDTTKSVVAEKALEAGASIINDISALRFDPLMVKVAARYHAPVILMHMKGRPKDMQENPVYEDLLAEVMGFLQEAMENAVQNGVDPSRVILDPGIGFGKTFQHNLILLKNLEAFKTLNAPLLVGASRKAFIRSLLKDDSGETPDPKGHLVETGSQAAAAAAAMNGAHIIRVHNVENTVATLKIIDAVIHAAEGDEEDAAGY